MHNFWEKKNVYRAYCLFNHLTVKKKSLQWKTEFAPKCIYVKLYFGFINGEHEIELFWLVKWTGEKVGQGKKEKAKGQKEQKVTLRLPVLKQREQLIFFFEIISLLS